jgi:N-acetylglucosamine kinase-like BadF-type ATPase
MAPLYVGLDVGGSGTRAALATVDGRVLAVGFGGPSGHRGGAAGHRVLQRALAGALAPIQAHVGAQACVVHVGLRGLSIPGRRETALAELAARLPGARVTVSNDALVAQWGGLGGHEGVAVLAGTGSIALARSADGRQARGGGYGHLVSDEGGGFWLGRAAVAACLRALDGRAPPTTLSESVPRLTGQQSLAGVVGWLYSGRDPVRRLARLAPEVGRAAAAGDAVAIEILRRGARALAELAAAAVRGVWADTPPSPLLVARCGGVWAAGQPLVKTFDEGLRQELPTAQSIAPRLPPTGGAILLAMGADNLPASDGPDAVLEELSRSFVAQSTHRGTIP